MNYKTFNKIDSVAYLLLTLVIVLLPEFFYQVLLLDFSATLADNQILIVRSTSPAVFFASFLAFLVGGDYENAKKINIVRYSSGLYFLGFGVFTEFNGFAIFALSVWGAALFTSRQLKSPDAPVDTNPDF